MFDAFLSPSIYPFSLALGVFAALLALELVMGLLGGTLLGMGEGVHEWCSDWFAADYYADSPRFEPQGPPSGLRRASRGGSWRHDLKFSRCAQRSRLGPEKRFTDYGFRVARAAR